MEKVESESILQKDQNQNEKMVKSRRLRGADSVKNRRKKIESQHIHETVSTFSSI